MGTWSVVRFDMWDTPVEAIGAFPTKEEAEEYARRSFYLGREAWEHKPVSAGQYYAVPWVLRDGTHYKEQ